MKEMKRILSLVLCLVMLVGILPVNAFATETGATEPAAPTEAAQVLETEATETTAPSEPEETTVPSEPEGTTAPSEPEGTTAPTEDTVVTETTEATEATLPVPPMLPPMIFGSVSEEAMVADQAAVQGDYLMFATDRHGSTSAIAAVLSNMESQTGANIEYVGLGGDMVDGQSSYNTSTMLSEVNNGLAVDLTSAYVDITKGSHDGGVNDDSGMFHAKSGELIEADEYAVYGVIQSDMESDTGADEDFVTWASDIDASKVIIVLSHLPLHDYRNDNYGAIGWHQALNSVAAGDDGIVDRDVIFFHGHNHSQDGARNYFYEVGKGLTVEGTSEGGESDVTNYYTYATAGYLKANGEASLVTITDTTFNVTRYGSSGSGDDLTGTITRVTPVVVPEKTITSVVSNDGTSGVYTVGDEKILFELVVNYSDGTSATVTRDECVIESVEDALTGAAITEAEALATPGEYAATVSYQGVVCGTKVYFSVNDEGISNYDLLDLVINGATLTDDVKKVSLDDTVVAAMGANDYVAYDIPATITGDSATVSVPVPADWEVGELDVRYVNDEGALTGETFEFTYADGKVTFTTNHFSSYVVTNTATTPSDGTSTVPGNGTSSTKDVWVKVDTPVDGGEYLIVSTGTAGTSGYVMGNSTAATPVSGTLTVDGTTGTHTYLETTGTVWTAIADDSAWNFRNANNTYLGYTTGSWGSYTLNQAADSATAWTWNNNNLYVYIGNYNYRYISGGSSWSLERAYSTPSDANVYLYQKKEATITTGTQTATYGLNITVDGTAASTLEANNVVNGETKQLGAVFTSTVEGQTPPSDGTWNITSSNTAVATIDGTGLVTFTGVAGQTVIRAEYTWTENGADYKVYNTLTITTTAMSYSMDIEEESATVKIGASQTLTVNYLNGDGNAVTAENVTWTSSDEAVATVENGAVTGVKAGSATITAEWTDPAGVKHTDTVNVSVVDAVYVLTPEKDTYIHKGVQNGQTLALAATLTKDGKTVENPTLVWSIVSGTGATIDEATGVLTFDGTEGELKVKVAYEVNESNTLEEEITVHIHKSTAITPEESTTDFPRWPNEGAVRFDKTATAVGDFSKTGVAQLELSMAGIPQKTGGAVDVVLVVDLSSSMQDSKNDNAMRLTYTKEASKAFVEGLSGNANNRLAIVTFNDNSDTDGNTVFAMQYLTEANVTTANTAINNFSTKQGTNYSSGLNGAQTILTNTKTEGRPQFVVFLSDGAPTRYLPVGATSNVTNMASDGNSTDNWISNGARSSTSWKYESYTTAMKAAGVTVYTVGLGLESDKYQPQYLLNDMSGPANEASQPDQPGTSTKSKLNTYYYEVADSNSADNLKNVFSNLAEKINAAATNIEVTDKITEDYEMVFKWPDAVDEEDKVAGQEFYIEVVNYALDGTTHERTGAYDVLTRIYLTEGTDGLSISKLVKIEGVTSTSAGTETTLTTTPKYTAVEEGEKGYFNLVDGKYVYVAEGTGGYNMTEGATVTGTADTVVLHTPYFSYTAEDKIIKWHVSESEQGKEIALRYFLYLTDSLESADGVIKEYNEDGTKNPAYVPAGTYPTNDYATLEYKNFRGNEVMQFFPEPQLTWNGAQVTYIFYLVDTNGNPVNMAGRVVQFNEAVFVTAPHTEAVVWNEEEGTTSLDAIRVANDLLPDDYTLYDDTTKYEIHVYETENGVDKNNHFIITAGNGTTKVYNTKAGTKYSTPGTYTKANVESGFDFANTTVAFAVVWERKLVEDTVVVDFGLPVDINVTKNDLVSNNITAIGTETPNADINDGLYTESALSVKVDETNHTSSVLTVGSHTAQVMNENVVRFTPGTMEFNKPITFNYETSTDYFEDSTVKEGYLYSTVTVVPATTVYYEDSFVDFQYIDSTGTYHENGWTTEGTTENKTQAQDRPGENVIFENWDSNNIYGYDAAYAYSSTFSLGSARKITVDANKSGVASFSFYGTGFDVVSMTSNKTGTIIVDVYKGKPNSIATIDTELTKIKDGSLIVDTYYGYTKNANGQWVVVNTDAENALYQVPVMNVSGLEYGQYTVRIVALYDSLFDHNATNSYDFYLDAIRIYDPTNDGASDGTTDTTVEEAYTADGERWPIYQEVRNNVISAADFNAGTINGIAFIDGTEDGGTVVADYVGYGPNNELYLAPGQSVVFGLDLEDYVMTATDESGNTVNVSSVESVHLGMKSADGSAITYALVDAADLENSTNLAVDLQNAASTLSGTATDMYYDITDLKDSAIVVYNAGTTGTISLTNVKVTFKQKPAADLTNLFYVDYDTIMNIVDAFGRPSTDSSTDVEGKLPISCPATVIEGVAFPVTINVPETATNVTVNGINATYNTEAGAWIAYVTAPTGATEMEITAKATVGSDDLTATATAKIAPYVKMELPASVKARASYQIRIYTAQAYDVAVTVNGVNQSASYDENAGYWTATITAGSAVEDSTEEEAVVVTVTAKGNSTTVKGTVDVYGANAFAPTVTVNTPSATGTVQKGKAASIKITTSSDVEKIILRDGPAEAVITTYRTSGTNRIWTTRYVVCNADYTETAKDIYAYACDASGYEDDGTKITFNITTSATSTIAETIKNLINSFIDKLFG